MDNIASAVISGVDKMFHLPTGCGEQTMVKLAPVVYGMYYLKQTGLETADNEETGTEYIRRGINIHHHHHHHHHQ